MPSHEEYQQDIPAYVASRLEAAMVRRLEVHLAGCDSCREIVATAKELAGRIREGGEALFEPHPRELELRDHALGTAGPGGARIERHLSVCATCRLEIEAWKALGRLSPPVTEAASSRRSSRWFTPSLAAAAGLALGVGVALLLQKPPEPSRTASAPGSPPVAPSAETWTGDSPLYVLPRAVRGVEEEPVPTWTVGKGESHLSVAVQPALPEDVPDTALFRLELRHAGGSVAWSMEMTAGRMREHLRTSAEAVHMTLPVENLGPGEYEFRILPAGVPEAPPLYRARVNIAAGS